MSYSDQLLAGMSTAIELEIHELAEAIAKVLARHIQETGEYPTAIPKGELDRLVGQYRRAQSFGPS